MVRQWAKFWWGVFDEHYSTDNGADPHYPSYSNPGKIEGTRCSPDISGTLMDSNGKCEMGVDGTLPESCVFVPDLSKNQTANPTASLMFSSTIDSVNEAMTKFEKKKNTL